jgi:hypothetical protein
VAQPISVLLIDQTIRKWQLACATAEPVTNDSSIYFLSNIEIPKRQCTSIIKSTI